MVPMLQCGFVRSNLALAMFLNLLVHFGWVDQSWTRPAESGAALSRSCRAAQVRAAKRVRPSWPSPLRPRSSAPLHSARTRSEEHTSELQSLMRISYAVFCLTKKKTHNRTDTIYTCT